MTRTKDTSIAYAAGILLGWFGAHRFYLGAWPSATIMLIATLFGWYITGIGWGWVLLTGVAAWWVSDLVRMRSLVDAVNASRVS